MFKARTPARRLLRSQLPVAWALLLLVVIPCRKSSIRWPTRSVAWALLLLVVIPAIGRADGLEFHAVGARAIGRAGAITVSADDGAALLVNPAGMARRLDLRVQLGLSLHDDDSSFQAVEPSDAVQIHNRAAPITAPQVAVQGGLGPFVVGAAYLQTGGFSRQLPRPPQATMNAMRNMDIARRFPHRYGGIELSYERRVWLAGAAVRALSWLGLGLSVAICQIHFEESRHIWAGLASRGDSPGEPNRVH